MHRFLPIIILIVIIATIYLYLPLRREVLFALHISPDTTKSCCTIESALAGNGAFDETANTAIFENQEVDYPKESLAADLDSAKASNVLGTTNSNGEEKWIEVSLDQQKLRAWEGNHLFMEFPISSGRWAPTPTGTFNIWYKTRSQSMVGGNKAIGTYYNLPNVPNNMFFFQGYAIHGAYWHNNFGHPMSHGCVNAPLAQSAQLFEWTGPVLASNQNFLRASDSNPGTRVVIH